MDRITRNTIGMDEYFDRIFKLQESSSNYPPYNLIQISDTESQLELALAGFKKDEVNVYTQDGKIFIEGKKEEKDEQPNYVHKGVAQRSFSRSWTLSDETEVRSVAFEDGLLVITLGKVVPEHHHRKDYL